MLSISVKTIEGLFMCFKKRALGASFYEISIYEVPFKSIDAITHAPYVDLPNVFSSFYNSLLSQLTIIELE